MQGTESNDILCRLAEHILILNNNKQIILLDPYTQVRCRFFYCYFKHTLKPIQTDANV